MLKEVIGLFPTGPTLFLPPGEPSILTLAGRPALLWLVGAPEAAPTQPGDIGNIFGRPAMEVLVGEPAILVLKGEPRDNLEWQGLNLEGAK